MAYSERLLDLVGLIYESASEPSLWPKFLERYSDAVLCTSTLLLLYDTDQRVGNVEAAARIDPVDLRRYNDYYVGVDLAR